MTNITIQNPNNLPLIDYRKCKPLQGELKDLSEANYKKLKGVLEKRGFDVPLFLWKSGEDYFLMDGHQRQRVMAREDMQPYEVPYILIEAKDEKEAKSKLLEITSQYGTITQEGFDAFIAELDEAEVLEAVHFDALSFGGKEETEVEEDEPPEVDDKEPPKSKLGEIYQLGRHRVMCGDSADFGTVSDLMDDKQANITFTDPPYLMDFTGNVHGDGSKSFNAKHGALLNDKLSEQEKLDFIDGFITNIKEFTTGAYYICWYRLGLHHLFGGLQRSELDYRALIIWDKGNHTLSNSDYMSRYEPIVYGWVKDHKFYGGRSSFDLWQIERTAKNELHPTMKPIALCAKAINDSTERNGIVLDLFLGSGSTLIACEQTDRTCYGMELDPKYVDVIRKRYWKFINDGNEEGWEEGTEVVNSGVTVV